MIGFYGKLPAHGDFVRRDLPGSFVTSWDAWLQTELGAMTSALNEDYAAIYDAAPVIHFCVDRQNRGGPAAGVILPSRDAVGRRFPLTIACGWSPDSAVPSADWFAAVAQAGGQALDERQTADELRQALRRLPEAEQEPGPEPAPEFKRGWWTARQHVASEEWPTGDAFIALLAPPP